jgi:hypothetical protein
VDDRDERGNEKSQQRKLEISGLEEKFLWWKKVFLSSLCVFVEYVGMDTYNSRN